MSSSTATADVAAAQAPLQQGGALSQGEQQALAAEQQGATTMDATEQAELETGTTPIPRNMDPTLDRTPSQLDPRFDPDDLRQGKAPPAARRGGILGSVNEHRPHLRKNVKKVKKVTKLVPKRKKNKGSTVPGEAGVSGGKEDEEEEMEEVEVEEEVDDDDEDGEAVEGAGEGEGEKKHGLMGKIFHRN